MRGREDERKLSEGEEREREREREERKRMTYHECQSSFWVSDMKQLVRFIPREKKTEKKQKEKEKQERKKNEIPYETRAITFSQMKYNCSSSCQPARANESSARARNVITTQSCVSACYCTQEGMYLFFYLSSIFYLLCFHLIKSLASSFIEKHEQVRESACYCGARRPFFHISYLFYLFSFHLFFLQDIPGMPLNSHFIENTGRSACYYCTRDGMHLSFILLSSSFRSSQCSISYAFI